MAATLTDLVQRTITRLSMVPGVAVQVYAEDRIAEMIWHKFVMVRDELWWDDLMAYATLTQDANGRPIENVVRELPTAPVGDEIVIAGYNDVQYAWRPGDRRPLKEMPLRANPMGMLTQGRTMFRTADPAKVIRFAPHESGQSILIRYMRSFARFMPNDIVPMDDQLMILGAAYDYLEDDGTNSGQTEKFRGLFNDRLRQLKGAENDREIPISPAPYPSSNGWQTVI
jgi:hypothetical protein